MKANISQPAFYQTFGNDDQLLRSDRFFSQLLCKCVLPLCFLESFVCTCARIRARSVCVNRSPCMSLTFGVRFISSEIVTSEKMQQDLSYSSSGHWSLAGLKAHVLLALRDGATTNFLVGLSLRRSTLCFSCVSKSYYFKEPSAFFFFFLHV